MKTHPPPPKSLSRRDMLKLCLVAGGGAVLSACTGAPTLAGLSNDPYADYKPQPQNPLLEADALVLFQGDSITDALRERSHANVDGAENTIGALGIGGYVSATVNWFRVMYPQYATGFINRGVSGDRIRDLRTRWQVDCLDLMPTWVSILVGVNDTLRRYSTNEITTPEEYEQDYRYLLDSVKQLPARVILMEPFLIPVTDTIARQRADLEPRIEIVQKLAREYDTLLVPLDGLFQQAVTIRPPDFWTADGVHPSLAGVSLMTQAWLCTVKAIA